MRAVDKINIGRINYLRPVRAWLIIIPIILPFQLTIAGYIGQWSSKAATIVNNLEEITILAFLLLAAGEYFRQKKLPDKMFFLLYPLIIFGFYGLISGAINGNPLPVTLLGTFDYIKNFLVIFIYAAFFRDFNEFRKVFRPLLFIAVFIGTIALIQFIWAMCSVYLLGKNITDQSVYVFSEMPMDNLEIAWRYGIFRTSSLTYHAYILGLFNLLIFTLYFYTEKRTKIKCYLPLLSGIIASVSRMAYGGLIFVMSIQISRRIKWVMPALLAALLLLIISINSGSFAVINGLLNVTELTDPGSEDSSNIRLYTKFKSIEIWKDHPLTGVGPGMFGGVVASKYNSYIYNEYNLLNQAYIHKVGGIEQFWFQILAEAGIVGALCFINIIIILFITLYKLKNRSGSQDMKNLFSALMVFIPCILIYTLGSGINIAPVFFTYCAFVGMGMGGRQ